jgi:hypothetical protein
MKALLSVVLLVASMNLYAEGRMDERKSKVLKRMDARIAQIQKNKACIQAAQSKDDMKACRKSMKAARESMKSEREERKKQRMARRAQRK